MLQGQHFWQLAVKDDERSAGGKELGTHLKLSLGGKEVNLWLSGR